MINNDEIPMMVYLDVDVTCYTCGTTGEHEPDCPDLDSSN
jgi:hypothetical protein